MIDYLDSFFDTRRKRLLFIQLLCCCGWLFICGCALYVALRLIVLDDYASLFSLLNDPSMELFVIARMILSMMSLAQGTVFTYLIQALTTISFWEWCLLGCSLFLFYYSNNKRIYGMGTLLLLGYLLACMILFVLALSASSLQEVVKSIWLIGVWTLICFIVMLVFIVCMLLRILVRYRRALYVHVVEIQEETDEKTLPNSERISCKKS